MSNKKTPTPPETPNDTTSAVTKTAFAALAGFKPSYVSQLAKAGRLVLTADGKRVLVAQSLARIEATRDPSRAGNGQAPKQAAMAAVAASGKTQGKAKAGARDALGATTATTAPTTVPTTVPTQGVPTYNESRAVKELYNARAAQRDYELSMGRLLEADHVRGYVVGAMTVLRNAFEQLPTTLASQCAAMRDEAAIRVLIADVVEQHLSDAAKALDKAGKAPE